MKEAPSSVNITNRLVKNRFPSEQYQSSVGVYGGRIVTTENNEMVYEVKGFLNKLDVFGDKVLRTTDDHVVKKPLELFLRHPIMFMRIVFKSEPMRRRGSPQEIVENIERLGLTEFYGPHSKGIEIKKPEVFTKGIAMADIYHVKHPTINDIDRFQALSVASKHVSEVHKNFGPIGDIVGDIIFQKKDGSKVTDPVLNIPDVILTPSKKRIKTMKRWYLGDGLTPKEADEKIKKVISREQKAVDVSELMISSAFEEFKYSHDPKMVEKTIKVISENYGDKDILKLVKRFIKRGRHTLPDSQAGGIFKKFFTLHNQVHLGANKEYARAVRQIIVDQL